MDQSEGSPKLQCDMRPVPFQIDRSLVQERVEAEGMDYAEFLKKMKKDKRNLTWQVSTGGLYRFVFVCLEASFLEATCG